jgi:hypothetical protein
MTREELQRGLKYAAIGARIEIHNAAGMHVLADCHL